MKVLEVRIEQRHIDKSEPYSSCYCAIAQALKEQHPGDYVWFVKLYRSTSSSFAYQHPGKSYKLPAEAYNFQLDMISKKIVYPFSFVMEDQ
ncbi:MAG TPA: hypothetical protein VEP90_27040 [Methylomirabilota bacterium]|nr:hypothetical protein [Methylomirabilota bacterium]